jgi:hypothetical protein
MTVNAEPEVKSLGQGLRTIFLLGLQVADSVWVEKSLEQGINIALLHAARYH